MAHLEPKYTFFDSVTQILAPQSLSELLLKHITRVSCQPMSGHSGVAGGRLGLKQTSLSNDWIMYSTDEWMFSVTSFPGSISCSREYPITLRWERPGQGMSSDP
jgi:hypothetical protein